MSQQKTPVLQPDGTHAYWADDREIQRLTREALADVRGNRKRIYAMVLHERTDHGRHPIKRLPGVPALKKMVMHGRKDPGVCALLAPSPGRSAHWWSKAVWR